MTRKSDSNWEINVFFSSLSLFLLIRRCNMASNIFCSVIDFLNLSFFNITPYKCLGMKSFFFLPSIDRDFLIKDLFLWKIKVLKVIENYIRYTNIVVYRDFQIIIAWLWVRMNFRIHRWSVNIEGWIMNRKTGIHNFLIMDKDDDSSSSLNCSVLTILLAWPNLPSL